MERTEIAAEATAVATATAAGYFSPRYAQGRQSPAYLVVIDQAGPRDQLAAFHQSLIQALARESGMRDLFEIRRAALSSPVLQNLASRFPDRILWVFAEPDALRNPFRSGPAEWLRSLGHWNRALVLSPLAHFDWIETQWKRLNVDVAVAPPTLEGILNWTRERPRWAVDDRWQLGRYPPLLRGLPEQWLDNEEPDARALAQLRVQLRSYLGRDGFLCLATCAIFPALSWEATLSCVTRLVERSEHRPHGEESDANTVLDPRAADILGRLVRLPWMRHNRMPQWLCQALKNGLSPAEQAAAHAVLDELVGKLQTGSGDQAKLVSQAWRRKRKKRAVSPQDYILLSLFWRRYSNPLSIGAPGWFERFRLRNGLFLKPLLLPAAVTLLLSAGLGYLVSRIPAEKPLKIARTLREAPPLPGPPSQNSNVTAPGEFLPRVLDVAASQVSVKNGGGFWAPPFVTWAFQETAAIVQDTPVRVVAARTEEEQWANAVKDPGVKIVQIRSTTLPPIEPGFVFAHVDPAGFHVGIVESVTDGHSLATLEASTVKPSTDAVIVRRYRDARNINVGFIDYAHSHPSTPEASLPRSECDVLGACPTTGCAVPDSPQAALNKLKRTMSRRGRPQVETAAHLLALQKSAEDLVGNATVLTRDQRTKLAALGEGSFVELTGYLTGVPRMAGPVEANCNRPGTANADLQFQVVDSLGATEARSAGATIVAQARGSNVTTDALADIQTRGYPVRVTGQLLYDNSRFIASTVQAVQLSTLWEIHPVYAFEVCPSGDCIKSGTGWIPLESYKPGGGAAPTSTANGCDPSLWQFVYNSARLPNKTDCRAVTGTIQSVLREADGDYHIRFVPEEKGLTNAQNDQQQGGALVAETVCQFAPTQADAIQPCSNYRGPKFDMNQLCPTGPSQSNAQSTASQERVCANPPRIRITGYYTIDTDHGLMELHPVSGIEVLPSEPGAFRWSIKTSLPDGANTSKPYLITLAHLLSLPPAAAGASPEFANKRYPKTPGVLVGEGLIVRTWAYLRLVAEENDGDLHMQLTERPTDTDYSIAMEVPLDDPKYVSKSTEVFNAAKDVRAFLASKLGLHWKTGAVTVLQKPVYVEVTGQLFFDSEHEPALEKGVFRGKSMGGKQLPARTSWEIHPVLHVSLVAEGK
jgi:hypothetical protein